MTAAAGSGPILSEAERQAETARRAHDDSSATAPKGFGNGIAALQQSFAALFAIEAWKSGARS